MSLARRALPSGALAWAGGCGDPGVCIVSMRLSAWQARWPGIASIQSDDAGSSVERESRCEPAFRGALRQYGLTVRPARGVERAGSPTSSVG